MSTEPEIVTPELYDQNKAEFDKEGIKVGDVMPETEDHILTEDDFITTPTLADAGLEVGDTVKVRKTIVAEKEPEVKKDEPVNVPVSEPIEDKKFMYQGVLIISDNFRTVENQKFHHIRCADGTSYDLLPEDYAKFVLPFVSK